MITRADLLNDQYKDKRDMDTHTHKHDRGCTRTRVRKIEPSVTAEPQIAPPDSICVQKSSIRSPSTSPDSEVNGVSRIGGAVTPSKPAATVLEPPLLPRLPTTAAPAALGSE